MKKSKVTICLLTDFGLKDGYVAAMKGVIFSIAPYVTIVDISHDIDPFCISSGAYVLNSVVSYFPPSTIFVAVVDPGVGTVRKGLVIKSQEKIFIGPDNGIFSWILTDKAAQVFWIDADGVSSAYINPRVSSTFHGRDIFSPIAAHIAAGINVEKLALPFTGYPVVADWVMPRESKTSIEGKVIHIDRFGNIVTNITKDFFLGWMERHFKEKPKDKAPTVEIKSLKIPVAKTYASVPEGTFLALWGSSDNLEISVNRGNAAKTMSVSYLEPVRIFMA